MVPELEKPRVTEIHVRMDCNGCVQKIKKALHGINGIYDLYIDFPQQKLTIIGWADPEKIVKAIKKTRKIATVCSHTEQQTEPTPPPPEQLPEGNAPPPDASNPPPAEAPPPEAPTQAEAAPPAESPKEPPPPEHPTPEAATPTPVAAETNPGQQIHHQRPRNVGEIHTTYHQPPDYGYRYGYSQGYSGYWDRYHNSQGHPPEPTPAPIPTPPVYVTHSYNADRFHNSQGHPPEPTPAPIPTPPVYVTHSYNADRYHNNQGHPPEHSPAPIPTAMGPSPAPPVYVTHSYNTYRPSPYVTEYEYIQPPPQGPPQYTNFSRINHYNEENYMNVNNGTGNGNITSIFSDENPNACIVM